MKCVDVAGGRVIPSSTSCNFLDSNDAGEVLRTVEKFFPDEERADVLPPEQNDQLWE